jgi:hypothetical protein
VVESLERLDDQEVDREPDRPAPVRIAAEQPRRGFGRIVVHAEFLPVHVQDVRPVPMNARDRAQAERGQELVLVEQVAQDPNEPLTRRKRQKHLHAAALLHEAQLPREVSAILEEPLQALLEPRELVDRAESST